MRRQFAGLGDNQIVVFREVHHEVERHRLDLAQPVTILTMMDVHSDARSGVVEESALELSGVGEP